MNVPKRIPGLLAAQPLVVATQKSVWHRRAQSICYATVGGYVLFPGRIEKSQRRANNATYGPFQFRLQAYAPRVQ